MYADATTQPGFRELKLQYMNLIVRNMTLLD